MNAPTRLDAHTTSGHTQNQKIDPRAPRFGASITAVLLLAALFLTLLETGNRTPLTDLTVVERLTQPGSAIAILVAALFAWSLISPATQPIQALFLRVVRPKLSPPDYLEDARPPKFAQAVGLTLVAIGLILHTIGVPWGLTITLATAFIAAGLNATIGWCMGCEIYLYVARLRHPAPLV